MTDQEENMMKKDGKKSLAHFINPFKENKEG